MGTDAVNAGIQHGRQSEGSLLSARRGFYFTLSSKLSNLFDLFGTPRQNAQGADADAQDDASAARQKHEDD